MSDPADTADNPLEQIFYAKRRYPAFKWVHYLEIYHRHLAGLVGRSPRVLEIGVAGGGGLEIWQRYFGPGASVVGIDSNPASSKRVKEDFTVLTGDQEDVEFLSRVNREHGPFDFVSDDGGHRTGQQITSFEVLYPTMPPRGVYIVEDTHSNFWQKFRTHESGKTFLQFAAERTEALMDWTRRQDLLGNRYQQPPAEREGEVENVSEFCRTTHSICFYDSVVVFERRPRTEPYAVHSERIRHD